MAGLRYRLPGRHRSRRLLSRGTHTISFNCSPDSWIEIGGTYEIFQPGETHGFPQRLVCPGYTQCDTFLAELLMYIFKRIGRGGIDIRDCLCIEEQVPDRWIGSLKRGQ